MSVLEDYKTTQNILYNIITKTINNNKQIHAYIINTSSNFNAEDITKAISKTLICRKNNTKQCNECNICTRIDNNTYTELKIIEKDGLWIKKEQLIELQKDFSTHPIEGKKRVYIIKEAEFLNKQSANSILKFLEEPADDIIALLITDNIHLVMDTIISRCQILTLEKNKLEEYIDKYDTNNKTLIKIATIISSSKQKLEENINTLEEKIETVINFIKQYETTKLNIILESDKLWHAVFNTKDATLIGYDIMILFYKDVINSILNRKIEIFDYYKKDIEETKTKNTLNSVIKKINIITKTKENIKYNANRNLLLDKILIKMEE